MQPKMLNCRSHSSLAFISFFLFYFGTWFLSKAKTPSDEPIDDPNPKEKANDTTDGSQNPTDPSSRVIQQALPPSTTQDHKQGSHKPWYHHVEWWELIISCLTFLALVAYTVVTYRQLKTMNATYGEMVRQYPELQKSAEAAKTNSDIAKNSFDMEKRRAEDTEEAECRLTGGGTAAFDNSYPIHISNIGKVTARNIEAHVEISLNAVPENRKVKTLGKTDISISEIPKENGSDNLRQIIDLRLSSEEWQKLADTKFVIVQEAKLRYENGFERIISNSTCDIWLYYRTPENKQNPVSGRGTDCKNLPGQLASLRNR
jgi:hypothetical protein